MRWCTTPRQMPMPGPTAHDVTAHLRPRGEETRRRAEFRRRHRPTSAATGSVSMTARRSKCARYASSVTPTPSRLFVMWM